MSTYAQYRAEIVEGSEPLVVAFKIQGFTEAQFPSFKQNEAGDRARFFGIGGKKENQYVDSPVAQLRITTWYEYQDEGSGQWKGNWVETSFEMDAGRARSMFKQGDRVTLVLVGSFRKHGDKLYTVPAPEEGKKENSKTGAFWYDVDELVINGVNVKKIHIRKAAAPIGRATYGTASSFLNSRPKAQVAE